MIKPIIDLTSREIYFFISHVCHSGNLYNRLVKLIERHTVVPMINVSIPESHAIRILPNTTKIQIDAINFDIKLQKERLNILDKKLSLIYTEEKIIYKEIETVENEILQKEKLLSDINDKMLPFVNPEQHIEFLFKKKVSRLNQLRNNLLGQKLLAIEEKFINADIADFKNETTFLPKQLQTKRIKIEHEINEALNKLNLLKANFKVKCNNNDRLKEELRNGIAATEAKIKSKELELPKLQGTDSLPFFGKDNVLYNLYTDSTIRSRFSDEIYKTYPSKHFELDINNRIILADVVLVIAQPFSQFRQWMQYELDSALRLSKPIIAVIPVSGTYKL